MENYEYRAGLNSYNSRLKIYADGTVVLRVYDGLVFNDDKLIKLSEEDKIFCDDDLYFDYNFISNVDNKEEKKEVVTYSLQEIRADSLTRSRNLLIDLAWQNKDKFNSFITLTFKDNIQNVDEAYNYYKTWKDQTARKLKVDDKELYILGVPEFQKRGAIHYHLLTSLIPGVDIEKKKPKRVYNQEKKKSYNLEYYDIKFWKYGFSSAFDLKLADDKFNVGLYITKYMYKDIDNRLYDRKKILKTNNLERPEEKKFLATDDIVYKQLMHWGELVKTYQYKSNDYSKSFNEFTFKLDELGVKNVTYQIDLKNKFKM